MPDRIELGDLVKDRLSGLTGVVTGKCAYISGCRHAVVTPQEVKDGKPVDGSWINEDALDVVEKSAVVYHKNNIGGPPSSPPRRLM